jgi:2'-5' RNA ligase
MYDYVAVIMFDDNTTSKILDFKNIFGTDKIKDNKKLPPHITIDLYENIDTYTIIKIVDQFIDKINKFSFKFIGVDNFDNRVIFLKPDNEEYFNKIKNVFDSNLGKFKIKANANNDNYKPHLTIARNKSSKAENILKEKFVPFESKIDTIAIFNVNKDLVKKYKIF